MFWMLLAVALTFTDPSGDAQGDGQYLLPTSPVISASAVDLRSFSAEKGKTGTRFTVGLGAVQNPWQLASGFSANVTDIFIKNDAGGMTELDDLGLRVAGVSGWQYHLRITGAGSQLWRVQPAAKPTDPPQRSKLSAPKVSIQGSNLIIDTVLPYGKYGYWVTSSVYTPLSKDGLLRPSQSKAPSALQVTRENAPVPVDVLASPGDLSAYGHGQLKAVGQTQDQRPLIMAGLALLGLLLTAFASWRAWKG